MNDSTDNLGIIKLFNERLKLLEDYLFGLYLYHYSAPLVFRWIQHLAYRQTISRNRAIIKKARAILEKIKADKIDVHKLSRFPWPPWTPTMEQRIMTMLRAYSMTFPTRPKTPLNKQEFTILQERLNQYL